MAKILVVDDRPDTLMVLRATLESAGHAVIETRDPRVAVSLAQQSSPDAIVLDIMMPNLSGWDVLEAIRRQPAMNRIPILMLSALDSSESKVRGLRDGADDFVTKPFVPAELIARIDGLIARQTQEPSGLQGRLEDHPFSEVIQNLEQNRKTGLMTITTPHQNARVALWGGKLVHAETSGLVGAEALLAMIEFREGSFVFQAEESEESERNEHHWISLHPLLLEASWLEDELRARQACQPLPEQRLRQADEWGEVPSAFSELPFHRLMERLEASEQTLSSLLELKLGAPNKIRLAVALLIEQGSVKRLPLRETVETAEPTTRIEALEPRADPRDAGHQASDIVLEVVFEDLDSAIRELFQQALFRGFSLDDVRLTVLIDDSAWESLGQLFFSLPDSLLGQKGRRSRNRLLLERSGDLVLGHEAGTLTLAFENIGSDNSTVPSLTRSVGVILWLGELPPESVLLSRIAEIQRSSAPQAGFLFVSLIDSERLETARLLSPNPRWRVPTDVPRNLEDLMTELCKEE